MSLNLVITLIVVSILLILFTTHFLKEGKIPVKYSLLWYAFALIIFLVGIFPQIFTFIYKKLGFEVMSNMIIGIFIGLLIILNMALCIMIAEQKKKTIMLIQELSTLKSKENKKF